MRNLKFRAWDPWHKHMFEPGYFIQDEKMGLLIHDNYAREERYTLMQYTGMKDMNGKEIFEGDIIHIEIHSHWNKDSVIASGNEAVKWNECSFGVEWGVRREFTRFNGFCETTFEVIGNIYESPDLISA